MDGGTDLKFAKVSFEQYNNDVGGDADLTQEYADIKLPRRATAHSAGYEIFSPCSFDLECGESIKLPLGFRALIDTDKFLAIYPRSGLGSKGLVIVNTTGIGDSDYFCAEKEGRYFASLKNLSPSGKTIHIDKGQTILQCIIQRYYVTEDADASGNRFGGFGSTDQ